MLGYEDKRGFFRMMMNAICELRIHEGDSSRTVAAICKDMSATGMSFEVDETVEVGCKIDVSIESTNSQIPSLAASTRVVRAVQQSEGSMLVGVEILEIT